MSGAQACLQNLKSSVSAAPLAAAAWLLPLPLLRMLALLLLPAVALLSDDGGGSAGSCTAAMVQSACGGRPPADCDVCAGQHQHLLRSAGCSAAEVAAWCGGLPVDATELFVVEGHLQPGGQYVGTLTSQVQALIDGSFAPRSSSDWRDHSIINSTILRTLHLEGAYEADVSLSIPSVRKRRLRATVLYMLAAKTENLPRQARDKHRENSMQKARFLADVCVEAARGKHPASCEPEPDQHVALPSAGDDGGHPLLCGHRGHDRRLEPPGNAFDIQSGASSSSSSFFFAINQIGRPCCAQTFVVCHVVDVCFVTVETRVD